LWTVTLGVERRGLLRLIGGRLDVMADGVPRDRERLRYVEGIGKRRDSYCYVVPAPADLRFDPRAGERRALPRGELLLADLA
jgi:hypothetical protein